MTVKKMGAGGLCTLSGPLIVPRAYIVDRRSAVVSRTLGPARRYAANLLKIVLQLARDRG
jgi:hypothetical protein